MLAKSFTLLLAEKQYTEIYLNICKVFNRNLITVKGDENKWEKIEIKDEELTINFNSLIRVKPMDQFSKMILGMYNFIDKNKGGETANKKHTLNKIATAQLAIGVVSTTKPNQEIINRIKNILTGIDAIVFNGQIILDNKLTPM